MIEVQVVGNMNSKRLENPWVNRIAVISLVHVMVGGVTNHKLLRVCFLMRLVEKQAG